MTTLNPIPISHWVIDDRMPSRGTLCKGRPEDRVQLYWDNRQDNALQFATQNQATTFAELLNLGSHQVREVKP